jgi:hypothetical protein
VEFKPKERKVRLPDMASRGRGVPNMPPAGGSRPVFRAGMPPSGAPRGRGRGRETPQRQPKDPKPHPKQPPVGAASPFGAKPAENDPVPSSQEEMK